MSSVLNSKTAIEINRGIMRAFVTVRQLMLNPSIDKVADLQSEVAALKKYMEEVLTDQNDNNDKSCHSGIKYAGLCFDRNENAHGR